MEKIIYIDGDSWRVVSVGATRDDKTYVHLASTTRFQRQRNGVNPIQMCDWIDSSLLVASL